jgi:hypothetical protein
MATLTFASGACPVFGPVPSVPQTIPPGTMIAFSWTFTPTGPGIVAFTTAATGTDSVTLQTVTVSASLSFTPRTYAADKVAQGKLLVAPNILDPSDPASRVVFAARGNAGAELKIDIYTETGVLMGSLRGRLDAGGVGTIELTGDQLTSHAPSAAVHLSRVLSTGVYIARCSSGGVNDIKPFAVRRKMQ